MSVTKLGPVYISPEQSAGVYRRLRALRPSTSRCRHTVCPPGFVSWHLWAERKAMTHHQERCPVCGLWVIWRPTR